eukprot:scaffold199066_cov36-Prasinocladus_malaysianus.AAC.3
MECTESGVRVASRRSPYQRIRLSTTVFVRKLGIAGVRCTRITSTAAVLSWRYEYSYQQGGSLVLVLVVLSVIPWTSQYYELVPYFGRHRSYSYRMVGWLGDENNRMAKHGEQYEHRTSRQFFSRSSTQPWARRKASGKYSRMAAANIRWPTTRAAGGPPWRRPTLKALRPARRSAPARLTAKLLHSIKRSLPTNLGSMHATSRLTVKIPSGMKTTCLRSRKVRAGSFYGTLGNETPALFWLTWEKNVVI